MPSLSSLSNPLVTPRQLTHSSSALDGIPPDLERSIRYAATRLTQAAGILLDLPQDVIAHAIVIFTRFWIGPDGGSLATYSAKDVSAASLYLTAKLSFQPRSPRSVLNVYAYLLSPHASPLPFINPSSSSSSTTSTTKPDPLTYYLSPGALQSARLTLTRTETLLLRILGFNTHVALPYPLALTYLRALHPAPTPATDRLAKRVVALLNTALLSPQLLYLTHQPHALAVAAIYLAAREPGVGVKLVDSVPWWEVFDVEREELGFLVVAMQSVEGFAGRERERWEGRGRVVPLSVTQVDAWLKEQDLVGEGERGGEKGDAV